MICFQLVETVTRDKLLHQGIFFSPEKNSKRALLWVHGLTSTFYSNVILLNEFAHQCEKHGLGFVSLNNRGHDMVTSAKKIDKRKKKGYTHKNSGAGYEVFTESIYDIEAGINFLAKKGFSEIIAIGHSTGALKVSYYAGQTNHPHLKAVVLAGAAADRLDPSLDQQKLSQDIAQMKRLIKQGRGDELQLGYHFFPITPKRFISLFKPNSLEDHLDYGSKNPKLKYFSQIKKPLLVIFGENDEYLDRPAQEVLNIFDKHQRSSNYKSVIIPDALHSFGDHEPEVVKTIFSWTQSLTT